MNRREGSSNYTIKLWYGARTSVPLDRLFATFLQKNEDGFDKKKTC